MDATSTKFWCVSSNNTRRTNDLGGFILCTAQDRKKVLSTTSVPPNLIIVDKYTRGLHLLPRPLERDLSIYIPLCAIVDPGIDHLPSSSTAKLWKRPRFNRQSATGSISFPCVVSEVLYGIIGVVLGLAAI